MDKEKIDAIAAMKAAGKSMTEVSNALGIPRSSVSYYFCHNQKERALVRYHKRAERISKYKEERPCTDCGGFYKYWQMQFDHLRDKEFAIGKMFGMKWERILAEIEKCELVCANCHSTRTHMRRLTESTTPDSPESTIK